LKLVIRNQDDLKDKLDLWGFYHLPHGTTVTRMLYGDQNYQSRLLLPVILVTDEF
jgi:hypothetical protein